MKFDKGYYAYMCRTLTGAWIETHMKYELKEMAAVAPSRVRGLKHDLQDRSKEHRQSHPHGCVD